MAECSASSMNIYGLLKLVRLKVLPESYKKIALRSWAAVNARYVKDGVVTGFLRAQIHSLSMVKETQGWRLHMGHRGLSQRGQRGRSITLTEKRGSTSGKGICST